MSRIMKVDLTTASQFVDLTGKGKLFLHVDSDTRLAFDQFAVDNEPYFILEAGTTYIFDQPNPFQAQPCYVRADTGTGTLRALVSG
jgi:hypothetical protein